MTLLSICQAVCNISPVAAPDSIVGNSDQTAVLLLALANVAGQQLARRPQGGWVNSIREYNFTTNALEEQSGVIENVGGLGHMAIQLLRVLAPVRIVAADNDIDHLVSIGEAVIETDPFVKMTIGP